MVHVPRRAATTLVPAAIFFAASTFTTIAAQNCVPYNSSFTAGTPEVSLGDPTYFRCPDDGFLLTVDASYISSIKSLSWTCSGGEEFGSTSSSSSGRSFAALTSSATLVDEPVSFSVAITNVSTLVQDGNLPLLSRTAFGGYDVDTAGTDITFAWGGYFGVEDEEEVSDKYISFCSSGSFATGVTVWTSSAYVYGIMLECAYATATCLPPNYPTNLLTDSSTPTTEPTAYFGDTAPTFGTPSPSATSVSTRGSSSTASTIVVGASVAGGLCFLAICAGLIGGCRRRGSRKTRHPDKPQDTFGTPATTGGGDGGAGFAPKNGIVTHVVYVGEDPLAADPSPASDPPPPYSEHPRYHQAPPAYPSNMA